MRHGYGAVPCHLHHCGVVWHERSCYLESLHQGAVAGTQTGHLWIMSLLYLATFGSFIGFSAGFAMLSKTQFPDVQILQYAFFGPFIGALAFCRWCII